MTKSTSLITALVAIIMLAACSNSNYQKTKSGIMYRILKQGESTPLKNGNFIKVEYIQKINDSVLGDSRGKVPAYARIDSVGDIYDPREIFPMLHKGDSVEIVQLVDSFMKRAPGNMPAFMKKGDKMVLLLKVVDVFQNEAAVSADQQTEVTKENAREIQNIETKLAAKKVTATKTASGIFVTIATPGDGPAVDSGKQVSVRYAGRLMETGKEFETNMTPGKEPLKFVIGRHQVIQGWDEGLRAFKKGGRGTLYIPGFLAYGAQPGPGGKPFETLEFDVEIVDVTDAPKTAEMPQMPPAPIDTSRRK